MSNAKKRKHETLGDAETTSLTAALFGTSSTQNDLFTSSTTFNDAIKERIDKNTKMSELPSAPNKAPAEEKKPSVEMILSRRRAQSSSPFLDKVTSIAPYPANNESCVPHDDDDDDNEDVRIPPDVRVQEIADVVRMHGFAVMRNAIAKELLEELSICAAKIETEVCSRLDARQMEWRCCNGKTVETFRFYEVASRCKGRMDVRRGTDGPPFSSPAISENKSWRPIVDSLLGAGPDDSSHAPVLLYAGLIFSFPGSDDQPWHQDGMPLFPERSARDNVLPPYAINVFVPLSDDDGCLEAGPTEFIPDSHVLEEEDAMQRLDRAEKDYTRNGDRKVAFDMSDEEEEPGVVSPLLHQGDALLYDYRVCHRGTANLTGKASGEPSAVRRILYLMYARPWFKDHLNFGSERLFQESTT